MVTGFIAFFFNYHSAVAVLSTADLWPILLINFVLGWLATFGHELSHAMAAYHRGAKVHKAGIGWYWVSAFAFVDTTEMWTKSKQARLEVNIAGVYFNFLMASLLSLLSYFGIFSPFFVGLFWFFSFGSYLGVWANLSSILEYDGYYCIMDILNMPNLRGVSYVWMIEKFPKLFKGQNPCRGHFREVCYWCYSLMHLFISIAITQLIVIEIIWPIFGWVDTSNPYARILKIVMVECSTWL